MNKTLSVLTLATALAVPLQAVAFDQLALFATMFPMDADDAFFYAAPLDGFSPESQTLLGVTDDGVRTALLGGSDAAATAQTLTGVDFSQVTGVLTFGAPPADFTVLFGESGFTADTAETLVARNFEQRLIDDFVVFAIGEDNALDLATARNGDPFNAGLGKSQRLIFDQDFLIRTSAWPQVEMAIQTITGMPSLDGRIWQSMILAVEDASGDAPHLDAAIGWNGQAFLDTPTIDFDQLDIVTEDKAKLKQAPGDMPVFPAALFALTQTAETVSVHIALPYVDSAGARLAAETLSERLVLNPLTPHVPRAMITQSIDLPIVVLTLDYPKAEALAARDLLLSWNNDVLNRSFAPLNLRFY